MYDVSAQGIDECMINYIIIIIVCVCVCVCVCVYNFVFDWYHAEHVFLFSICYTVLCL